MFAPRQPASGRPEVVLGVDDNADALRLDPELLALLALQLYVHQSRRRSIVAEPSVAPEAPPEPAVVRDSRLLQALALPHAA